MAVCVACGVTQPAPPQPANPTARPPAIAELTPEGLPGVWLGMTLAELRKRRPNVKDTKLAVTDDPFFTYDEPKPTPGIFHAVYWFHRAGEQRIYKMSVSYRNAADAKRLLDERYAPQGKRRPSSGPDMSDQIRIHKFPYLVAVWTRDHNELNLGVALPDTLYEHGEFE
jgi:hypothetical protein